MPTPTSLLVLLAACAFCGPVGAAEPPPKAPAPARAEAGRIDLRPKFALGQVTRYVMKQRSTQSVPNAEDPNMRSEVKQTQDVGLKMTVKSVSKETGEATVEIVYETVKASIDSDALKINYDSTQPTSKAPVKPADPNDPLAGLGGLDPEKLLIGHFEKMVGTTMMLTVDKSGRIAKTTGGDTLAPSDLLQALGAGGSGGSPGEVLQPLFGPITSKGSAYDGTVKVGGKWRSEDNVSLGLVGTLVMATDYELRSAKGNTAEIGFRGRVEPKSQGENSLFQVNEGSHSGQYVWDTKLGQMASVTMDMKMSITSQFTGGQPSASSTAVSFERVKGPAR